MASIKNFERTNLHRYSVHEPVKCTYCVFDDLNGQKHFQIDTYGSIHREILGKKSQSIQLDEKSARALFDLLKTEFKF